MADAVPHVEEVGDLVGGDVLARLLVVDGVLVGGGRDHVVQDDAVHLRPLDPELLQVLGDLADDRRGVVVREQPVGLHRHDLADHHVLAALHREQLLRECLSHEFLTPGPSTLVAAGLRACHLPRRSGG
ncbi:MAG: hypothetical protein QM765_03885 [Myxococcales bacterium]